MRGAYDITDNTLTTESTAERPDDVHPLPGPYDYSYCKDGVDELWFVETMDGREIASYNFWDEGDGMALRVGATFRLLAAAPELVEALKALLAAIGGLPLSFLNGSLRNAMRNARAIIARVS
jgi:hypothetical protein